MKDFYATLREVYGPSSRNSHPIKSKDGKLLTTKNEIKERWVEHFSELLNNVTETVLDEIDQRPIDYSLDEPITEKELDDTIKRSKLGKIPMALFQKQYHMVDSQSETSYFHYSRCFGPRYNYLLI